MKRQKQPISNQQGFTIIELLIATAVLSMILVLVTVMMISIGNLYYKGINQSRVQSNVRSLTEEVSQHLQLIGGTVLTGRDLTDPSNDQTTDPQAYCIGTTRYSYLINRQIDDNPDPAQRQSRHVLWRDTVTSATCPPLTPAQFDLPAPTAGGAELIAPRSRLMIFSIEPRSSPYTIAITEAYGDTDLLNISGANTICRGNIGDQFCATASLTTTVVQRVSSN